MSDHPNIVWVTLDSVRYDHTSMAGYERDTTPAMADIAAEPDGRSFERCFAHANYTRPSSGSILTGTYPRRHGIGMAENEVIPSELPTVAELLSAAGYRTVCVSPNPNLSPTYGFERGFDEFVTGREDFRDRLGPTTIARYALHTLRAAGTDAIRHANHLLSETTIECGAPFTAADIVAEELDGDEPVFVYVHLNAPHYPYRPPVQHLGRYTDDIEMSTREAFDHAERLYARTDNEDAIHRANATGCQFDDDEWEAIHSMYDACIRYGDDAFGWIADATREADRNGVVVATADHGELFGEGGFIGHGMATNLQDPLLHVPLVTYGLDVPEIEGFCQHIDVVRTILLEQGVDHEELQGIDLRKERREYVVAERRKLYPQMYEAYREQNAELDDSRFHHGRLTAVRDDSFKFLGGEEWAKLFALPEEGTDHAEEFPDAYDRLSGWYEEYTAVEPAEESREADVNEEVSERLRELGYIVEE